MTDGKKTNNHFNNIDPELEKLFNSQSKKEILCVYSILKKEKVLSTKKLVEIALSQEFNHYCQGCAAADNVYRAVKKLQEKGFVLCHMSKEGYIWKFIK